MDLRASDDRRYGIKFFVFNYRPFYNDRWRQNYPKRSIESLIALSMVDNRLGLIFNQKLKLVLNTASKRADLEISRRLFERILHL